MSGTISEEVMFFVTILVCAIVFFALSVWCFASKNPVHFWTGQKVLKETISDIKKYNRANGILWLVYSFFWFISAFLGLYNLKYGAIGTCVSGAGIFILMIILLDRSNRMYPQPCPIEYLLRYHKAFE